ncbi:hypothetical protein PAPYR_12525 [Paratrimastix pyriformis]|uniref:Uncharacterized protein n=1 Tax=Paratrimastix pyriformis TaxID=342808 RepID=A0ABQ8U8G8_9EUKA|nr:hypothetical protein PAPYR_12525 [Paratrimastix pyriformis]
MSADLDINVFAAPMADEQNFKLLHARASHLYPALVESFQHNSADIERLAAKANIPATDRRILKVQKFAGDITCLVLNSLVAMDKGLMDKAEAKLRENFESNKKHSATLDVDSLYVDKCSRTKRGRRSASEELEDLKCEANIAALLELIRKEKKDKEKKPAKASEAA